MTSAFHSYRYQRPFVMKDDGADGHWIEDAAGVPLDRSQILEVLNGSLGPKGEEWNEAISAAADALWDDTYEPVSTASQRDAIIQLIRLPATGMPQGKT